MEHLAAPPEDVRKVDAAAFLATAGGVVASNAVVAVTIGCSFYVIRYIYLRLRQTMPGFHAVGTGEAES